jgi:hypothetical protein
LDQRSPTPPSGLKEQHAQSAVLLSPLPYSTHAAAQLAAPVQRQLPSPVPCSFRRETGTARYDPLSVKRPVLVGKLTENIVYKRLPEGVLDELKTLNPKDEKGRPRRRHHQFLTEDIGNPHLEKHVASAVTLMKISPTYHTFKRHLDTALPIPQSQMSLPFGILDDDEDEDEDDI